jgi:hypothetical protein
MDTQNQTQDINKPKKYTSGRGGHRPGAGRPSPPGTPPGTKPGTPAARRKIHSIKFSDLEWEQLQARATAAGLTAAEYIRQKALT